MSNSMQSPSTIRSRFPIFAKYPGLAYLDNAATTQKPDVVIEGIYRFYTEENANIHRGIYPLAAKATALYEESRNKIQVFIKAPQRQEIIFTAGATAAINLVAQSFTGARLKAGDRVLITAMEHHANLIPWQMVCQRAGAELCIIPMNAAGTLDLQAYQSLLSPRTKMVALVHISNTLGTINPIEEMIDMAHHRQIPILIDAAQSVAHYPIDVQSLDCDFLVFSGHKLFGPTGIGVLYGKTAHLETMEPYQFGGDMIKDVTFEKTTFAGLPNKFEAGTPNIAGAVGLGYAIDFLHELDRNAALEQLKALSDYAHEVLAGINGLRIIGTATRKSAIISFTMEGVHPHDMATFLGEENIALRAGHHCTQPIMDFYNIPATIRASFSIYNNKDEVDRLVQTLKDIQTFFA
ncbi:MAG: cysteine desulfurase [Saprospiraceae bacterium]